MDTRIPLMGSYSQPVNPVTQQLNQLQVQKIQNAMADQAALNQAWKESGGDLNKLRTNLIQGGQGSMIPAIEQSFAKTQQAQGAANQATTTAITGRMNLSRELLNHVDTPEKYLQWQLSNLNDPVMGQYYKQHGITPEAIVSEVQDAMQKPGAFDALLNESKQSMDQLLQHTYQQQNLGGTQRVLSLPKYGTGPAQVVPGSEGTVTKNPNAAGAGGAMTPYQQAQIELGKQRLGVAQQEEARKQASMVDLPPKTRQAREAAYPKSTMALKQFMTNSNDLISKLETLRNSPGLTDITGAIAGRLPAKMHVSAEARKALALLNTIKARGGFQELNNMKQSSPTGGALGQVSDREEQLLQNAFGSLDTSQDTPDFQRAIDSVINEIKASQAHTQQAYDMDYAYRQSPNPATGKTPATKPAASDDGWHDL